MILITDLILRIIEFISQFYLTLIIANSKTSKRRLILGAVIYALLYKTFMLKLPQYFAFAIATSFAILVISLLLKVPIVRAISSYFISGVSLAIIDFVVSFSLIKVLGLESFDQLKNSPIISISGRCIITMTIYFEARIIKMIKDNKNKNIEITKSNIELVNIIVTFFVLLPNLIMVIYYYDKKTLPFIIIVINILAIIAMFFISLYNTQRGIKLVQAEEELLTEKTYNKTLEDLVDGLRTFKHDYNNTLQTMYGYILTDNMSELKNFFNQILTESREITALDKLKPELFKNPSLFGLVTAKFEYARKSEVTMNLEVYGSLDNLEIKTYDFTRMFGIFLDNAIEASAGSEKKVVNLYVAERNGKVTIEISNSFSDTGLKVDDMSKKGVSSKGDNRGLGLYKVKEILKKYPRIKLETNSSNDMFLQRLVIDKIKEVSLN